MNKLMSHHLQTVLFFFKLLLFNKQSIYFLSMQSTKIKQQKKTIFFISTAQNYCYFVQL